MGERTCRYVISGSAVAFASGSLLGGASSAIAPMVGQCCKRLLLSRAGFSLRVAAVRVDVPPSFCLPIAAY